MSPTEKTAKTATGGARKTTKKTAAKPAAPPAGSFEATLSALGRKADEARERLSELGDESARAAGRQLQKTSKATRDQLQKLERNWKKLEPKKKAQLIAGVLGAIAAAAVPLVVVQRRKAKKRKTAASATKS